MNKGAGKARLTSQNLFSEPFYCLCPSEYLQLLSAPPHRLQLKGKPLKLFPPFQKNPPLQPDTRLHFCAKDMKHRLGFLLQKSESCDYSSSQGKKEKISSSQRVSQEEVRKWAVSLENLIHHDRGLAAFRAFLKSEYSEENIEFWVSCEDYKKTKSPAKLSPKARKIYDEFISVQATKEVNLDSCTREKTSHNMLEPTLSCFDEAQRKIFTLMEKDSYRRFLKSPYYLDLVSPPGAGCGPESSKRSHTHTLDCNSNVISQCA